MNKRGVKRSNMCKNFLGYAVKDNKGLDTNSKGGFGVKSGWPHLFLLSRKLNLLIQWEKNSHDINLAGKAMIFHENKVFENMKHSRKKLIEIQTEKDGQMLKDLPMQGTLFKIEEADYLLSQNIFMCHKLSDK